ncbi:hypothetical protein LguiA_012362 [Lonicera macranthoides]
MICLCTFYVNGKGFTVEGSEHLNSHVLLNFAAGPALTFLYFVASRGSTGIQIHRVPNFQDPVLVEEVKVTSYNEAGLFSLATLSYPVNGLFQLHTDFNGSTHDRLTLWNPATAKFRRLKPKLRFQRDFPRSNVTGFGWDPLREDYKVVWCHSFWPSARSDLAAVALYRHGNESWRQIDNPDVLDSVRNIWWRCSWHCREYFGENSTELFVETAANELALCDLDTHRIQYFGVCGRVHENSSFLQVFKYKETVVSVKAGQRENWKRAKLHDIIWDFQYFVCK